MNASVKTRVSSSRAPPLSLAAPSSPNTPQSHARASTRVNMIRAPESTGAATLHVTRRLKKM